MTITNKSNTNAAEKDYWRDVIGFEGLYKVSRNGDVYGIRFKSTRKPYLNHGYYLIDLYKNNIRYHKKIHRLVAQAFIENPANKPIINHKNGIKTDNSIHNLEWATYKENNIHAHSAGLANNEHSKRKGIHSLRFLGIVVGINKKTSEIIYLAGSADMKIKGFCPSAICSCINGKAKTHKGFYFKRINYERGLNGSFNIQNNTDRKEKI